MAQRRPRTGGLWEKKHCGKIGENDGVLEENMPFCVRIFTACFGYRRSKYAKWFAR
jgi:hypothetical protein